MNIQQQQQQQQRNQIEGEEDDDVASGESIDNNIRFEPHPVHHDGGAGGELNGVVDGVHPHALYVPGYEITPAAALGGGADQLTLSFQGEVYVFDSVLPEKVSLSIFRLILRARFVWFLAYFLRKF